MDKIKQPYKITGFDGTISVRNFQFQNNSSQFSNLNLIFTLSAQIYWKYFSFTNI